MLVKRTYPKSIRKNIIIHYREGLKITAGAQQYNQTSSQSYHIISYMRLSKMVMTLITSLGGAYSDKRHPPLG